MRSRANGNLAVDRAAEIGKKSVRKSQKGTVVLLGATVRKQRRGPLKPIFVCFRLSTLVRKWLDRMWSLNPMPKM